MTTLPSLPPHILADALAQEALRCELPPLPAHVVERAYSAIERECAAAIGGLVRAYPADPSQYTTDFAYRTEAFAAGQIFRASLHRPWEDIIPLSLAEGVWEEYREGTWGVAEKNPDGRPKHGPFVDHAMPQDPDPLRIQRVIPAPALMEKILGRIENGRAYGCDFFPPAWYIAK